MNIFKFTLKFLFLSMSYSSLTCAQDKVFSIDRNSPYSGVMQGKRTVLADNKKESMDFVIEVKTSRMKNEFCNKTANCNYVFLTEFIFSAPDGRSSSRKVWQYYDANDLLIRRLDQNYDYCEPINKVSIPKALRVGDSGPLSYEICTDGNNTVSASWSLLKYSEDSAVFKSEFATSKNVQLSESLLIDLSGKVKGISFKMTTKDLQTTTIIEASSF